MTEWTGKSGRPPPVAPAFAAPACAWYESTGAWGRDPVLANPYYRRELACLVERAGGSPIRILLDLGAGFGRASAPFRARVERAVLLEGSSWMLGQIRLSSEEARRCLRVRGDIAATWPIRSASADLIVGLQILNHMPDLSAFFGELRRVLAPGGRALLSMGNSRSWMNVHHRVLVALQAVRGARNPLATLGLGLPVAERVRREGFCRHTPQAVLRACRAQGMEAGLVGGSGLLSPIRALAWVEAFNRIPLFWQLSHLVLLECARAGDSGKVGVDRATEAG